MQHLKLLRPLVLQKLFQAESTTCMGDFKKWISSGNYILRDIPSSKHIDIEVSDEYSFHQMLAFDSCRMSAASFETMYNIQSVTSLPKSYGWIAIKSYYAAFFAAHSIIRNFGYICSQLEKGQIVQLNSYGQVVGLSNTVKPEAGYFSGNYIPSSRMLSLRKMKNTHEDTWDTLIKCLNETSKKVLSVSGLSAHKQQLSSNLSDLIDLLTYRGRFAKGGFLSNYRNSINYRHEHDSWYPYGKHSIRSEKIPSLLISWRQESYTATSIWKESQEAFYFFNACRDLVNFNYLLFRLILESSNKPKNLYKRWPARLLNVA